MSRGDRFGGPSAAKVALQAENHVGRERIARYLARSPIASERLSLAPDGRVV